MSPESQTKYSPIDLDEEKAASAPFLPSSDDQDCGDKESKRKSLCRTVLSVLPWATTVIFATTTFVGQRNPIPALGSYERGFATDIVLPSKIPLETRRFTGSSHFYGNGTAWLDPVNPTSPWPENMQLFGTPTPEIDHNWERLLGGRYVSISEEEATRAWGEKRHEYVDQEVGGYTAGMDMFHILHCVNILRKVLRPDNYAMGKLHGPEHTEHCLNLIRQSVQCSGSTSLIPSSYREGIEHNYVDSDQLHTCRSFQYLREWTNSRQLGQGAYVERDMGLVDERKHELAREFARTHESEPFIVEPIA
ncbi:hypothetical protein D0Z07_5517 [Hyphodiscus hymeniophilus]|uniref:Tat pathway signal sequence n=1 Tax=Hyphodiscus hymeniophilus TaxID=353542 RepID=A0A9P6VIP0_9HELO|nr:hypothetical protein D0Z07_5517 [Hyphodiscus hymeniophilus]